MKYEPIIKDSYYHIYNCGNNKEDIFIEERNYAYFLSLLKKHILPVAELLSYCLLKNHFHLLVKTKSNVEDKFISQAFSNCFNAYTKAINKAYGRTGSLFQDRFSRIKITDEEYLKSLIIYINNNAVHHGFTQDVSSYKYSSYQALVSDKPTLLSRTFIINLFENTENFSMVLHSKKEYY
ncbi:transposase [Winogradskyella ouciana]|uniref:Transposase n=1 Tax=Winogradskyella ouciana TaxID=2608631 RepID=A0A7K1GDB6_9FLAO|nr:transposase [Winogradskyella ouciana]MTE26434.1 transposase [Winogradskyella ouciana]